MWNSLFDSNHTRISVWWSGVLQTIWTPLYSLVIVPVCSGLLVFGSIFQIMEAPLEFGFHPYLSTELQIVSSILCIPLIIHSARHTQASTFPGYLLSYLDIIAALPHGLIANAFPELWWARWGIYLYCLRLCYTRFFMDWHRSIDRYLERLRCFWIQAAYRFVVVAAFDLCWINMAGCILFHTAYSDPEYSWMTHVDRATLGHDFSAFKKLPLHVVYSTSFYFAYATVSTVGYGDIHPHTPYEMYIVFTITLFMALVAIISSRMMGSLLDLHGVYQRAEDSRAVRRARALRVRKALQTAQEAVRDQSTQRDLRLKVATTAEVYRDAQIDLARSVAQASQRVRHADDVFQASEAGLSSQIDLEVQAVRQEMQAQADHVDQMAHEVHVAQAAQTAHATDSILRALQALAELETQEYI